MAPALPFKSWANFSGPYFLMNSSGSFAPGMFSTDIFTGDWPNSSMARAVAFWPASSES